MQLIKVLVFATAVAVPGHLSAQEAYLQQISAGPVSVAVSAQPSVAPAARILSRLRTPQVAAPRTGIDLSAYPVSATPGAFTTTVGNNNAATIVQSGTHAGTITQTGNANTAMMVQAGSGNRAAICQASTGARAQVLQTGGNNSALIVQR
ncbi:hypothetical protein [Sulfitobacter sp. S190]|uniref:hypothetical protein n=1 Tax=Sulfitobacter sp. S190 TaxID=2867022 RepID=UPI0021A50810|nr:hypothetical protein [Sulfitobacter sp. S190]UWR23339.1 hypothetical protein K3756_04935 [Sulfitobacter sp. S190]